MSNQSPVISLGYKLFKEFEEHIEMIRIVKIIKHSNGIPDEIMIRDEGNSVTKKVDIDYLKGYTPLEPDGYITFNITNIKVEDKVSKDVVVTASKILNIKVGDLIPFAVCRQSITDIFYNLLCKDESEMIAGLSINQNNCPTNFDFRVMLACDEIEYSQHVNFYRTDTIDDILGLIKTDKFDNVLSNLYSEHIKASKNPNALIKKKDKGWCRDLETLLKENNFQTDINEMLGITEVDFDINKYLLEKPLLVNGKEEGTFTTCTDELKLWLSSIFKVNISECTFIEFGHDINLADFNNSKYVLLRDKLNKLYLVVYTCSGEYLEYDLANEAGKKDFSSEFRLNFYNKYNHIN